MRTLKLFTPVFASVFLAAVLSLVGCAKEPTVGATTPSVASSSPTGTGTSTGPADKGPGIQEVRVPPQGTVREDTPTRAGGGTGTTTAGRGSELKDVLFDYDRAALTEEAKRDLDANAVWLRANLQVRITVEGHCDERGTNEYNLALGDRRAKTVRDYLVASGIDVRRIVTISYGEERPFNPGHDESAWRENRRAHFVINR